MNERITVSELKNRGLKEKIQNMRLKKEIKGQEIKGQEIDETDQRTSN